MASPNILFILADDLGWRDLGCYGSTFYETPNLDALAADGTRFTDAYAACPVCSPTRASLLTGKYPARVGVTNFIAHSGGHPSRGKLIDAPYINHLPASETSLAAALRDGGYQTWHVGKWHLGSEAFYPEHHGFDVNIGGCSRGAPGSAPTPDEPGGYFAPWAIPNLRDADVPQGTHLDDYLTDCAVDLIRRRDPDRPWFLNMWYYLVHTPIEAPQELINKYTDKARRLGLDTKQALVPGERFPTRHKWDGRVTRRVLQSDPVYAAMIEVLDRGVGRLIEALHAEGIAQDTVVMFTSDNGGLATAEGSPTCNAPLAEGKGWMYEGGTREPLIVARPGHVPAGATCDRPVTSPDLYPTCLDLAGLPPMPKQHVDGTSFAPLLRTPGSSAGSGGPGSSADHDRPPLFWHYPHYGNQGGTPGCSIRDGDHKLIEFFEDGRLELYHLRDDPGEQRNLADDEPETARRLHDQLVAWREQIEAKLPQPNPDYDPRNDPHLDPTV